MADQKLTDRTLFAGSLNILDLIHVVDVSDTSQDPAGSSFKLKLDDLKDFINENIYNTDGTLTGNRAISMNTFSLEFTNGNVGFRTSASANSTVKIVGEDSSSTKYALRLEDNSFNVLMWIRNDGNIAVNTITPTARLHIVGSGATDATYSLRVYNSSGGNPSLSVNNARNVGIGVDATDNTRLYILGATTDSTSYGFQIYKGDTTRLLVGRNDGLVAINQGVEAGYALAVTAMGTDVAYKGVSAGGIVYYAVGNSGTLNEGFRATLSDLASSYNYGFRGIITGASPVNVGTDIQVQAGSSETYGHRISVIGDSASTFIRGITGVVSNGLNPMGAGITVNAEASVSVQTTGFYADVNGATGLPTLEGFLTTVDGNATNSYGIRIINNSTGGTNWGVHATADQNYFSGKVGIGTATPNASAILDLTSTTGALLVPRMTTAQEGALTATNGMIIYNTDTNKFRGYENGAWANLI